MAEAKLEKPEVSPEVSLEGDQKPKRQKLMTDYQVRLEVKHEQEKEVAREQENSGAPGVPELDNQGVGESNQEVEALRTLLTDDKMIQRGQKAMMRSKRKRREKLDKYSKYIRQYTYLASIGDKRMGKARFEANKLIEGWMDIRELAMISEEEEPPDEPRDEPRAEPTDKPPEVGNKNGDNGLEQEAPKTNNLEAGSSEEDHRGKVKSLTEYFDKLGKQKTPKTPNKTANTPTRSTKSGGIKKNTKRKNKIDETQRSKMEAALRKFLKPPE